MMWKQVTLLLEMIRFSHTLFALPFALLAAVMAWTAPLPAAPGGGMLSSSELGELPEVGFRWLHLLGILVCMAGARSAAMAFNRLADRRLDAANPRTQGRHLPAGLLSVRAVVCFTLLSCAAFMAGTLLFLPNRLPIYLALPVLGFLLAYSYTKRFTALAHFWLGAALMLAPVCAWIALRGQLLEFFPADLLPAVLLGMAVLLWVSGFDIIYACQDVQYDVQARLHSVPAALGVVGALRLAAACHCGMLAVLLALPLLCPTLGLGWIFGAGLLVVAVLLVYQHWLVRPDDLTRVNLAFFHVNAALSIGLLIVGTVDLLM